MPNNNGSNTYTYSTIAAQLDAEASSQARAEAQMQIEQDRLNTQIAELSQFMGQQRIEVAPSNEVAPRAGVRSITNEEYTQAVADQVNGSIGAMAANVERSMYNLDHWVGGAIQVPDEPITPPASNTITFITPTNQLSYRLSANDLLPYDRDELRVLPTITKKKSEATLRRDAVIDAAKALQALIGETYPYTHKKKEQAVLATLFAAIEKLV